MNLNELLKNFHPTDKEEQKAKILCQHLLNNEPRCFWRDCFEPGHFTAGMWVVNPNRNKVLLMEYPNTHFWLQFGGHADGIDDLLSVACRELEEESGLSSKDYNIVNPSIFDI